MNFDGELGKEEFDMLGEMDSDDLMKMCDLPVTYVIKNPKK